MRRGSFIASRLSVVLSAEHRQLHYADEQTLIIPGLADWCCNSLTMLSNFGIETLQNRKKLKKSLLAVVSPKTGTIWSGSSATRPVSAWGLLSGEA